MTQNRKNSDNYGAPEHKNLLCIEDCQEENVSATLVDLFRRPKLHLIDRWNWKSALTSSVIRATIFFSANLTAGLHAALGAMLAEFTFRAITSGFYGSLTQAFRNTRPRWAATATALLLLPLASHSLEFLVHWLRGTPKLYTSITVSIAFTALSTLFNLYAMRRGALLVAADQKSLFEDMRAMPAIIASFLACGPISLWRLAKSLTCAPRLKNGD